MRLTRDGSVLCRHWLILTFVVSSSLIQFSNGDNNCFVSNCEDDDDPCADLPDKNLAIYKEQCMLGKRGKMGTIAICCRPNSDEAILMTAYGAEKHEFPHMVHVQDNCGGTLYNRRFVISAAHCVTKSQMGTVNNKTFFYEEPIKTRKVFVRVGSNIKTVGEKIQAAEVHIHPFYSSLLKNLKTPEEKLNTDKPILYDIALIKLEKDVVISDKVRTLRIADKGFMPAKYSKRAVMLGWGTTDDLKTWFGTYYLQKVNSPIRSERECPIWETDPYPKHKDKLICVGGYVDDDYAPTAGPGDSGGPLICKDEHGRAILCGVASFAGNPKDCAKRIKNARCYPNAFSSIPYYHDWIVGIAGTQDEKDFYQPILNGEAVLKPTEFPHEVYMNSSDGTTCGGTLISPEVVLTAASCVLDEKGNFRVDLTVYAGLNAVEKEKQIQKFEVDLVHGPPKFRKRWPKWVEENSSLIIADRPHFHEDIIMVQLERPIKETKYVSTLAWATTQSDLKDQALEISWKISKSGLPFLQKRRYNLLSNDECQERLDRVLPVRNLPLSSTSICGVEEYSGGSACDRTTGGPMLCTTKDKKTTYVCGIQSFRFCSYAFPNVITDVRKYATWIEDGLEKFDREKDLEDMYGSGYDYDYDRENRPPGRSRGRDRLNNLTPPENPRGKRPSQLPRPSPPVASEEEEEDKDRTPGPKESSGNRRRKPIRYYDDFEDADYRRRR